MKIFGFVVIIIGLILCWVGITGDQHNLMATLTGGNSVIPSGQSLNPSGGGSYATTGSTKVTKKNSGPTTGPGGTAV